jgi:acetyl esterase/lipase
MKPSWQLRVAVALLRALAKPMLERTVTPEEAERDFARFARLFRQPGLTLALARPVGGVPALRISAGPVAPRRTLLWLHGGAFLSGSARTHLGMLARLSRLAGLEVVAPDYRLLQEAPFPAAGDDARAAWEGLRAEGYRPGDLALGGDSAGGGLALALLADILGRGERPAALVLFSPWADLTLSGESLARLGPGDPLIPVSRMAEVAARYLAGADPSDPRATPILADFPGAPAALIQVGAEEALLSDAERAALRLGPGAVLERWPGCPHGWQLLDGWVPEARAALCRAADFLQEAFAKASR